jgi:uncharacterized phage-associated protein
MKFKKIIVPNYIFRDELGEFVFHNVGILVSADSTVTPETFNQESDDFSISSTEIEKLGREAAQRYFNDKYTKVLKGEYEITPTELNGIRLFLGVNGTELAKLLNLNKSSISRIINSKNPMQRDTALLVIEKLGSELETPGITKHIVERLEADNNEPLNDLSLPAEKVAEWIIRKFVELEECVTNLKLQKLLYYVQGIGIGRYHTRVIAEDFYAWEHGPVVTHIYHKYKSSGAGALVVDSSADLTEIKNSKLATEILNETMSTYGKFSAWVLRNKTHCEPPWVETIEGHKIELDKMRSFFKEIVK